MYSGNQIKKAGKKLIQNSKDSDAMEILSFWRATHEKPLRKAFNIVEKYSKKLDKNVILAQRLKRTPSIIKKLIRFEKNGMKLNTMQDIGGCRVILSNMDQVNKLIKILVSKNFFEVRNDYILEPKKDGYRSIHLKGKFKSDEIERTIELQIRTKTQHSWATAVEIVDLFTKQHIKLNEGEKDWTEFFKHTSVALNFLEKSFNDSYSLLEEDSRKLNKKDLKNLQKNYSMSVESSLASVKRYSQILNVLDKFDGFAGSIDNFKEHIDKEESKDGYIIIVIKKINLETFEIRSKVFAKEAFSDATKEYLELEQLAAKNKKTTIALIATSKINDIREAYPNYFADSTVFLKLVSLMLALYDDIYRKTGITLLDKTTNSYDTKLNILAN